MIGRRQRDVTRTAHPKSVRRAGSKLRCCLVRDRDGRPAFVPTAVDNDDDAAVATVAVGVAVAMIWMFFIHRRH